MRLRVILGLVFSFTFSWALIYFVVLGNTFTDFVNSIQGGVESLETNLLIICLIQFSAYPLLFKGQFILLAVLVCTGLSVGLICIKNSASLIIVLVYSITTFMIPLIIFIANGVDALLAVNNILFLFVGPSIIQIILNLLVFEAILILSATIGAAIIK